MKLGRGKTTHVSVLIHLIICQLDLIEGGDPLHPMTARGGRIRVDEAAARQLNFSWTLSLSFPNLPMGYLVRWRSIYSGGKSTDTAYCRRIPGLP